MPKRPVGVLSLGLFIIALAICASAFTANMLVNVFEIFSLTLVFFGLWITILAGMRTMNPEQYGEGAFNTFAGGILMATLGIVWSLYIHELLVGYLLATLLLVVGIMVAVVGVRAWQK